MKNTLQALWAGGVAFFLLGGGQSAAGAVAIRPDSVIVQDIARAEKALVAVGERGTVLRSEDEGKTWSVAPTDVTRTLTAVAFATPDLGIAVGHGGTLIHSQDGGRSWRHVALPGLEKESFLGVQATGPRQFAAFGTFGLLLTSEDGGTTWTRRQVVSPDFDRHLYGMVALSPDRWLVVGETGTLALTADRGGTWRLLSSPYQGSFFGAVKTPGDAVVVFGMRGNAFRSDGDLTDWTKVETATAAALNGGRVLPDGRVLLLGNNGVLAVSADAGRTFRKMPVERPADLAAAVDGGPDALVLVGENGISHVPMSARAEEKSRE
ncbi:MAG: WD40/YVTN/BNR-like repeat-containing protein [Bacteroidota bacterium]